MDLRTQKLEELHQRYAGVLFHRCLRILGHREQAEDAVQDTFIKAYAALSTPGAATPFPWLCRIATNVCLDFLRKAQRTQRNLVVLGTELPTPKTDGPEELLHVRRLLLALLERLDERSMLIVVAHHVDGLQQGEIATQLGISRRAVVKRLTRIRALLEQVQAEGVPHA